MRYAYPAEVLEEPHGVTITCPDVPEMFTSNHSDVAASLAAAPAALAAALSVYVLDNQPLPMCSDAAGRPVVKVPALTGAKLTLHAAGISDKDLAQRLGANEKAVRCLRDPMHRSHINDIEAALRHLGKRLEVVVREAV